MLKLTVIGNLGRDAEVKEINGQIVIQFSIGINEPYTNNQGQKVDKTTWVNCSKWQEKGSKTGIVQYLTKGTKVLVEGKVDIQQWKDAQNQARAGMVCRVRDIYLLNSTANQQQPGSINTPTTQQPAESPQFTTAAPTAIAQTDGKFAPPDDLPF